MAIIIDTANRDLCSRGDLPRGAKVTRRLSSAIKLRDRRYCEPPRSHRCAVSVQPWACLWGCGRLPASLRHHHLHARHLSPSLGLGRTLIPHYRLLSCPHTETSTAIGGKDYKDKLKAYQYSRLSVSHGRVCMKERHSQAL